MLVTWQKTSSPPASGLMKPKPRSFHRSDTPVWTSAPPAPPLRGERERERERDLRRGGERERDLERRGFGDAERERDFVSAFADGDGERDFGWASDILLK